MNLTRLREWRRYKGYTQKELADAADLSLNSVSRYELGQTDARPSTARKLAEVLEISVEDLNYPPERSEPDPLADAPERLREPLRGLSPAEFRRLLIGSRDAENWLPGNAEDTVGALQEAKGFMFRHGISREELHQTLQGISPFSARKLLLEQEYADMQAEEDAAGLYEEVLQGAVASGDMGIREAGDRLTRFSQGAA